MGINRHSVERYWRPTGLALALLLGLIWISAAQRNDSHPAEVPRHVLVTANGSQTFKVRVQMFPEEGSGFALGAYYRFESAPWNSEHWQEFMTVRQDDPDPIPCDHVQFIDERIGYVFMSYQFAVTTDSGMTWSVWNIVTDLPDWQHRRAAIRDVVISQEGAGTMTLEPFGHNLRNLFTKDFGRHWSEQR